MSLLRDTSTQIPRTARSLAGCGDPSESVSFSEVRALVPDRPCPSRVVRGPQRLCESGDLAEEDGLANSTIPFAAGQSWTSARRASVLLYTVSMIICAASCVGRGLTTGGKLRVVRAIRLRSTRTRNWH